MTDQYEASKFEVGSKLVTKLMEQDLTLTQKISLQEKLLQMSETKHDRNSSGRLEGVELSPNDKRRLKSSLDRDRKILARSISREREL